MEKISWIDSWETIDDDDLAAIQEEKQKTNEDSEFSRFLKGEAKLDNIIPDEQPVYITGSGFDDGTAEELVYLHKKYPNVILKNDRSVSGVGQFLESDSKFDELSDKNDETEEIDNQIRSIVKEMQTEW